MQLESQEGIGKVPEVSLENRSDTADIVEAISVKQVKSIVVSSLKQLGDGSRLAGATSFAIDTLVIQCWFV